MACVSGIELHRGGSKVAFVKADWDPLSVAVSHDGAFVAVGGKVCACSLGNRGGICGVREGGQVYACHGEGCRVCVRVRVREGSVLRGAVVCVCASSLIALP